MFAIEIFISVLAALPSAIVVNLNKLETLFPLNSETTQGDVGDWYCSKYQPILVGSEPCLASGK